MCAAPALRRLVEEELAEPGAGAELAIFRALEWRRELGLGQKDFSDDEIIALMSKHPDLIQRPIVEKGEQAMLARPAESIDKLL